MAQKEKEDFVVADRRKFTPEGELRPDAPPEAASEPISKSATSEADKEPKAAGPEAMPDPPSAAEQDAQHKDYQDAGKKIDDILQQAGAKRNAQMDVTFERLIVSLYMQSMAQLGMIREEGTPPQPDIVSARQTIDTIALLGEKTKGNLTERESSMLQNCLFELRMAFLEITNALTTRPNTPEATQPKK